MSLSSNKAYFISNNNNNDTTINNIENNIDCIKDDNTLNNNNNSILPIEIWIEIYLYLEFSSDRSNFEKVSLLFRTVSNHVEKNEIYEIFKLHLKYLNNLNNNIEFNELKEDEILKVENQIGIKIPFHLREFIKLANNYLNNFIDKNPPHLHSIHWSGLIKFQNWKIQDFNLIIGNFDLITIYLNLENFKIIISNPYVNNELEISIKKWLNLDFKYPYMVNPFNIDKLSNNLNDLKIILNFNGSIFGILNENLKKDKNLIKLSLKTSGIAFKFINEQDSNYSEYVNWYFENGNTNFENISKKYINKEILMKYSQNWNDGNFEYLNDKEILLNYCKVTSYIPEDIKNEELIIEFAKYGKETVISQRLFSNELVAKLLNYLIPKEGEFFGTFLIANEHLLNEQNYLKIIKLNPIFVLHNFQNYSDYDDDIILNREIVLKYINEIVPPNENVNIENLPLKFRRDKIIAKVALLRNFQNYAHLDEDLKQDLEFLEPIIERTKIGRIFNVLNDFHFKQLYSNNERILRMILKRNPSLLCYLPINLSEQFVNSLDFYPDNSTFEEILSNKSKYEKYCELKNKL